MLGDFLKNHPGLKHMLNESTVRRAQLHFKNTFAYTAFFGNEIQCTKYYLLKSW